MFEVDRGYTTGRAELNIYRQTGSGAAVPLSATAETGQKCAEALRHDLDKLVVEEEEEEDTEQEREEDIETAHHCRYSLALSRASSGPAS